jgi:methyl-accepting chemotaxis protein-1 (serine sensor receptor)
MKLSKIKLSSSLLLVLATFVVFQMIAQGLGFWAMRGTRGDIMHLTDLAIRQAAALDSTVRDLMDARINLARAATRMARGGTEPADIVAHARQRLAQADKDFSSFVDQASGDTQSRDRVGELTQQFRILRNALGDLAGYLDANNFQPYLDQPTQRYQDDFIAQADRYADFISRDADSSLNSVDERYARFSVVGLLMLGVILIVSALASVALKRAIVKPLEETEALFRSIAGGRLNNRIAASGFREFTHLQAGLGAMQVSLAKIVASVRTTADFIHSGAHDIATGNSEIAARTEDQASSLQQTAASMDELTATIGQTAEHAVEASRFAAAALREAEAGNEVVSTVVVQMNGIAESARRIAEIIAVIDGIAFQTNILALNAAVEAARAGEQGRGFAVVASEVRALAQRTAVAAKEIKQLIESSVSRSEQGVDLVEQAKVAIGTVSQSISRVAGMIGEISGASVEQSTGFEQMNRAISEMDSMTKQKATLVERAATAAKDLNEQTSHLIGAVATFHLQ